MIPKPPWRCWHDLGRTPLYQAARLTIATLALTIPAPVAAQGQLDTLRIDSLMSVAADRVQSAAIAAAREDADVVLDARTDLFGYGGVFGDVLGDLAAADCEQARHWVNDMAEELFWLSSSLTLAVERSADGEMDQWPNGPEVILDELEALQETWAGIKDENRELCNQPAHVAVRNSRINWDSDLARRTEGAGAPAPTTTATNQIADSNRYRTSGMMLTLLPVLPGRARPCGSWLQRRCSNPPTPRAVPRREPRRRPGLQYRRLR